MIKKTLTSIAQSIVKTAFAVVIFFSVLWVTLGFDKAIWTVDVLVKNWLHAINQMNFLLVVFALVVGLIGLMWALNEKLESEGRGSEYEKFYQYLAFAIFAAISGILVAIVTL